MITGIRAGLVSLFILLVVNLSVFNDENIRNFMMITTICIINSFLIGTSVFLAESTKIFAHLKHIAALFIITTLVVFTFLQYPFINHIFNPPQDITEIKVGFGKIIYAPPENMTQEEIIQKNVIISIG